MNNLLLTLAPNIVSAFLKNCPKKLFFNCYVDGLLTSNILNVPIVYFRDRQSM